MSSKKFKGTRRGLLSLGLTAVAVLVTSLAARPSRSFTGLTIDYITGVPSTIYADSMYTCRVYFTEPAPADSFAKISGSLGISGEKVAVPLNATYADLTFTTGEEVPTGSASLGFAVGQNVYVNNQVQENITDTDSASLIWGP